jgi:hypothetical protein
MDGKDLPIWIYAAASGTENDFAARVTRSVLYSALITRFGSQSMRKTYIKSVMS